MKVQESDAIPLDPQNGWYRPHGARVAHFFDAAASYSQCRYWEYSDRGKIMGKGRWRLCKACAKGMGLR